MSVTLFRSGFITVVQTLGRQEAGTGMNWRASGGDVVLDGVFDGCILGTWGGQLLELLKNGHERVCRRRAWYTWSGGGLRSKDTINSQLGDGVNQLVVGDIDQELEVVQKIGSENGVLDVCNEENPPKGAPEPKIEGVGLSTECRDAVVVDCLQRERVGGGG